MRATHLLTHVMPACLVLAACSGGGVHSNVVMGGTPMPGQSTAFLLEGDPAGNYGEAFIDAEGKVTATGGGCQLSGVVQASGGAPGTLPVSLAVAGCAAEGKYDGYLIRSADYAPGAFRVVADDGKRVVDGYAIGMQEGGKG